MPACFKREPPDGKLAFEPKIIVASLLVFELELSSLSSSLLHHCVLCDLKESLAVSLPVIHSIVSWKPFSRPSEVLVSSRRR